LNCPATGTAIPGSRNSEKLQGAQPMQNWFFQPCIGFFDGRISGHRWPGGLDCLFKFCHSSLSFPAFWPSIVAKSMATYYLT
jgi:hypothetical protein